MIDLNSWPAIHALIYLASPFVLGGAGLLIGLYLGYSHRLPAMLEALRNSKDIMFWSWLKDAGPFGRILLLARISATVVAPSPLLKRGIADPDDLRNFPRALKNWLVLMISLLLIASIWLIATYLLRVRH